MTAKGHVMLSSAITLGIIDIANYRLEYVGITNALLCLLFYIFTIIGSLLPDIDEPHSYIGNKLKIFSILVSIVGHRTITHYFVIPLALILISLLVIDNPYSKVILLGIGLGMINHDIGDMLTKGGIRGFFSPIFPNTKIVLLPNFLRFETFSITEYVFIGIVLFPINAIVAYSLLENIGGMF